MKANEIREKTVDELQTQVVDLSENLCKLRFQHGIRPLENTAKLKMVRRDIARLKTVINEKLS